MASDMSWMFLGADPNVVRGAEVRPDDRWKPKAYSQVLYSAGPGVTSVPLSGDLAERGL